MSTSKTTILGIAARENTQKYFFLLAAKNLGLKVREFGKIPNLQDGVIREKTILEITDGWKTLFTSGATTSNTSYLGMKIAVNKTATNTILRKFDLPTTRQMVICSEEDLVIALSKFGKIIMKPSTSRAGKGVFSNINTLHEAKSVYATLKKDYNDIVAEGIVEGKEYRILVVNGKVFAVAEYVPPSVTGDGKHTIFSLIQAENSKRKSAGDTNLIKVNQALRLNLRDARLAPKSILPLGEVVILHKAAPISSGGYTVDATERIHPENKLIAERAATLMNIDIAGIDIITPDIAQPIKQTKGAIIEINGGPDLDVHFSVREGMPRNGAEEVLRNHFRL